MPVLRRKIGCYWWVTTSGLESECGKRPRPVEWPRSGTNCQHCGQVMAYADSKAQADELHERGQDIHHQTTH